MIRVSQLYCYPFKSARGIALEQAHVVERGIEFDRRWMAVDVGGRFLSQRTHPLLSRITPRLESGALVLSAPGMPDLALPIEFTSIYRRTVVVWDDTMSALSCGDEADDWISTLLGERAGIVYFPDDSRRMVDPRYAHKGEHTAFSDGFPVLVLSQASLDDLNARLGEPLPMNRFRPNIVVEGCGAFAEDTWTSVDIGTRGVSLALVKPCARCPIPTIDQETMVRGVEPLQTLAAYRNAGGKVFFGQNALVDGAGGIVAIGDVVTPMLRAE